MDNIQRKCGCKGRRTCLICESKYGLSSSLDITQENSHVYCPSCNKAYPGWDMNLYKQHPDHVGQAMNYPGIFVLLDFINTEEEEKLLQGIDEMPWDLSQSGRRKQNFGPKCNFKKQKLKAGTFHGFPAFTKFIQEKFEDVPILKGFKTIEQCTLEYDCSRGAKIDPHVDDCWVWGERVVTVNLLADSVLTMTSYFGKQTRYNLPSIETYPPILDISGKVIVENSVVLNHDYSEYLSLKDVVVRIPMPKRSILVIYGPARYKWEHSILREDITTRRICLAYREFTPPFLRSGIHSSVGEDILEKASLFWDHQAIKDIL